MCGILACFGSKIDMPKHIAKLKARGPEGTRVLEGDRYQLGFTRLAINGLTDEGMQPMESENTIWMCNGEIYNAHDLSEVFNIPLKTGSDCEIIGKLFESNRSTFVSQLHGVFATIVIDKVANMAIVARDPYGVRPLFYVESFFSLVFASEVKAIPPNLGKIKAFPPGCLMTVSYTHLTLPTILRV